MIGTKKSILTALFFAIFIFCFPSSFDAENSDRITGSMSKTEYTQKYQELNDLQNETWNQTYNFKTDTNVKQVASWEKFKEAYEDNNVSKIIMTKDITAPAAQHLQRVESIEIDGGNHTLKMLQGTLNVEGLVSMAQFTKKFSDTPLFHLHDIEVINGADGVAEGGNYWSFINGYSGLEEIGGRYSGRRGIWRYRIGNVKTPKGPKGGTQIGGRFISGCLGDISMWGYNTIVTGAENFYTGGMTIEPFTFYKGENTIHNYSTVWFRLGKQNVPNNVNKPYLTGTEKFDVGEGAFVYLNNTRDSSVTFPGVFEWFKEIHIGKNATYNANIPGTAVSFNMDGSKFIGDSGSKVNLLSRSSGRPTVSMTGSAAVTSTTITKDTSFEMAPDSELYVVGSNISASGIIEFASNYNGKFLLNSISAFDIRNLTNYPFMGRATGTNNFTVLNSDISIWKNASAVDGTPDLDTNNVALFSVNPIGNDGQVTGTDYNLNTEFKRSAYKRISGFNNKPELQWVPVTDADLTQKARVLLGYVPVGGSDPFDENGDAKVKPIYADGKLIAKSDMTDTIGNTYVATSSADGYLTWSKDDHKKKDYQVAGKNMLGTPFKVDSNNQRYREGAESSTTVIDVTPPEPAKVDGTVTNVSKKISGTGEAKSKVSITVNGTKQNDLSSTVGDDGKWEIAIPKNRLKKDDKVQIFLEDNAPLISSDEEFAKENKLPYLPADRIPATNSKSGNINPKSNLTYSDTVFKAATSIIVQDVVPPTPNIDKIARALTKDEKGNQIPQGDGTPLTPNDWKGKVTKVNNTLSYRIAVRIPGTKGKDTQKVLYNAKITDKIPEHLTFNKEDIKVWKYNKGDAQGLPIRYPDDVIGTDGKHLFNMGDINLVASEATLINDPIVEYDEATRDLTVGIGDRSKNTNDSYSEHGYDGSNKYGHLLPGDNVVIEFPTVVTKEAAKQTIKNTAKISGFSAEEITSDPLEYREISVTSNEALSPGGDILGELILASAPEEINFGTVNLIDYTKPVGSDKTSIDKPLIVKDTLRDKDWKVTVKLIEEMHFDKNGEVDELPNSLYVRYKSKNNTLTLNDPVVIYMSDINSTPSTQEEFNISNDWKKDTDGDGIKMKASKIPYSETYTGKVEWAIENTQ
ncbi:pectate lyase-like adhesive domain-containing protein [Vagococcus carniphilus]|uniref:pectate lyase-like adhesive domain-containing protein n=1 Tax=Vagococcus carniphilus TaxID=218144 RepID=UPI003BA9964E